MIYKLEGHSLRNAAEEILLHLLPACTPEQGEDDGRDDFCLSCLQETAGGLTARAQVRINGVTRSAERNGKLEGEGELAHKRMATELVKLSIYDAVLPALPEAPVWGSLTGVRPAKLARGMMDRGMSRGDVAARFRDYYQVSAARTALAMRSAAFAQSVRDALHEDEVSLYVGIPFCPSRCAYCSFVSHSIEKSAGLIPPYLEALLAEIRGTGELLREKGMRLSSIYIGGGTPTTLSAERLGRLMAQLEQSMDLSGLREYTVEAGRPDTITPEKLAAIRAGGADRVSINPQSMNDAVLALAGRKHSAQDVLRAYEQARKVGFKVINMDTIAGLDGDTPASFASTIDQLIALEPENITVHSLAIKRAADLSDKAANAKRRSELSEMLDYTNEQLSQAGYGPYYLYRQKFSAGGFENVGWCKPDTEGWYNIVMMEEIQTILSVGAGGVSKRVDLDTGRIERFANPKYPKEYIESAEREMSGKYKLLSGIKG